MNFTKKSRLLVCAVVAVLISCNHKENVTPTPNEEAPITSDILTIMENYFKIANQKVDGTFIFESNVVNNDPSIKTTAQIGGVFYDKKGNVQHGGGTVSIGGYALIPNKAGSYGFDKILSQQGLYGTNVAFHLNPPSHDSANSNDVSSAHTAGGGGVNGVLYSPQAISITNVPPRTGITLSPNSNTTITWNTDPNNPNGVVVIAEYLPTRYINKTTLGMGNVTLLEKAIDVPDNGSTALPWSFFSSFPQGGHIILWVGRGNYTIANDGSYQYAIGGYTAAAVWDVLVPFTPISGTYIPASTWTANIPPTTVGSYAGTTNLTIVTHSTAPPTNWGIAFTVGLVSSNCKPVSDRTFSMQGPSGGTWSTTVKSTGEIFTHWVSGALPPPGSNTVTIHGSYPIYN